MEDQPLPKGFTPALDIYEEKSTKGRMVNMIGIARDYRLPMLTRNDYKATVTLFDLSTHGHGDIFLNIFKPEKDQIPLVGAGDIVIMLRVKVQKFRSDPLSLITNAQSAILVYEASKIPPHPASIRPALREPSTIENMRLAETAEVYSSWMYQKVDKSAIPDVETFNLAASRSMNIKDKFSLLENVRQDKFYNIVAQIVRPPYDLMDKATIWVTDYTENESFFNRSPDSLADDSIDDVADSAPSGDPYGYTNRYRPVKHAAAEPIAFGPHGKRCMQVTCYEPHATKVRDLVSGSWVLLNNVQVKYGSNGSNLEGFLREDRGTTHARVQVDLLKLRKEGIDPRLKDALRRKRDYEASQTTEPGEVQLGKRQRQAEQPESKPLTAKQKRNKRRKKEQQEKRKEPLRKRSLRTSTRVITETTTHRTTSAMRQPLELRLPFNCVKYRANVRVVDFYPQELEDFASWRKISEYDCLDGSSTSSISDGDLDGDRVFWEWRFALQLQDAAKTSASTWVVVDNMDAQLLLSFKACDLRDNPNKLSLLRERLFLLWGNLEEIKTLKQQREKDKRRKVHDMPPDSSDAEAAPKDNGSFVLNNRPFSCCIRQYGIKTDEPNPLNADAGKGQKWKRMFGLFGTKITTN
ncbi:hypothetical protein F5X68DRAFT_240465 [Plectosphaerella plurivora]|uniref:Protection of telomeres protein 1 n=1 Tax=Plectosphaerella plurivora TaxID=936078 RepID=A0A9P8VC02_9PEZI|nr:hypothetical protein F5X68DRAFT_240465 [Plectosphaerella plurivora]